MIWMIRWIRFLGEMKNSRSFSERTNEWTDGQQKQTKDENLDNGEEEQSQRKD